MTRQQARKYRPWAAVVSATLGLILLGVAVAQLVAQQPPANQPPPTSPAPAQPQNGLNTGLRGLIDQARKALNEAKDISGDEKNATTKALDDAEKSLDQSTAILEQAKRSNANALRQAGRQVRTQRNHSPNIVLILADDLGYGELASYQPPASPQQPSAPKILTPNLDLLAGEGMRFADYYSASAVELASHGSLMTGLHTGHSYLRGDKPLVLRPQDCTMAEVLWQAGYSTMGVGKWILGDLGTSGHPNLQGFDYWFGTLNRQQAQNNYPEFVFRNSDRVEVKDNADGKKGYDLNEMFLADALNMIEHREKFRPFFLQMSYTLPAAGYANDGAYADQPWNAQQKRRAAAVSGLDRHVGQIIAKLRELGLDHSTVVMLTSDGGPQSLTPADLKFLESAGPFKVAPGELTEGVLRVPLIVRWPGVIPAGSLSQQPCGAWDLLATTADLADALLRPRSDGVSLRPALLGSVPFERRPLYWESHEGKFSQALRLGPWKAWRPTAGAALQLFDLNADPGESQNVAAQNAEEARQIDALLKTSRSVSEHWPTN